MVEASGCRCALGRLSPGAVLTLVLRDNLCHYPELLDSFVRLLTGGA